MAAQLQHQVQMMMSAAAAGGANPLTAPMFGAGSRVDSPQLPGVGAAQNQYGMSEGEVYGSISALWERKQRTQGQRRQEGKRRGGSHPRFAGLGENVVKPCIRSLVVNLENSKRMRTASDSSGSLEVCNYDWGYNQAWVELGRRFYDFKTINKSSERPGYKARISAAVVKNGEGCTSCTIGMQTDEVTSMLTKNSHLFDGDSGSLVGFASHFTDGFHLLRRQGLQRIDTAFPWYVKNARGCTLLHHDGSNVPSTVGDGVENSYGPCDVFSSDPTDIPWLAKIVRGCTLSSNDFSNMLATVVIDRTKNSYGHRDVVSSGSPFYCNKPLHHNMPRLSLTFCQPYATEGYTTEDQNLSARSQTGWVRGHQHSGLLVCFRCFLLLHQAAMAAFALLQLLVFVIQRILFLNYEGQKETRYSWLLAGNVYASGAFRSFALYVPLPAGDVDRDSLLLQVNKGFRE